MSVPSPGRANTYSTIDRRRRCSVPDDQPDRRQRRDRSRSAAGARARPGDAIEPFAGAVRMYGAEADLEQRGAQDPDDRRRDPMPSVIAGRSVELTLWTGSCSNDTYPCDGSQLQLHAEDDDQQDAE